MWYFFARKLGKRESIVMKKIFLLIFPLALLIIIAIITIPYLLNSHRGNKAILSKISQNINYTLEAERLYFSWGGPQRAEHLTAVSSSGVRYYFPELSLPMPLWKLFRKKPSIGITRISDLIVRMPPFCEKFSKEDNPDSRISISTKCPPPGQCTVFGEIHVTNGLFYLEKGENPINLSQLQYTCTRNRTALHINAKFPNATEVSSIDMECSGCLQDFQVKAREVPTYLLGRLKNFSSQISLQEIIGPKFDVEANANLKNNLGPISLTLISPNLSIMQSGELRSNHYVLDKPLTLSLQLSKEALHSLFYHPILQIDQIDEPLRVNIPSQEIPLPLSLNSEINDISIYIGKITCMNKDLLFRLASELLHIDDSKINITFSEIPAHYRNGILQIFRSELVVQDKYPLAIWGNIDYFQKKVHLKLGIPERTLRKVFGIKSLSPNCMITCTIKGNFDDIQLDTSKLVKKIAILMAKDKAKKQVWKEGSKFFKDSTDIPHSIQSLPRDSK